MTSMVAILGLLPASLATGLGFGRAASVGYRHHLGLDRIKSLHVVHYAGVLQHLSFRRFPKRAKRTIEPN